MYIYRLGLLEEDELLYLVCIFPTNRGTETGAFLLFLYRKWRIFSIASASLKKLNSYPILEDQIQHMLLITEFKKK